MDVRGEALVKALVLSSHPLADRVPYKADVLAGLVERGLEVSLLYSGTSPRDYYREARRRGLAREVGSQLRRLASRREGGTGIGGPALRGAADSLGIDKRFFRALTDPSCLGFVESYGPEVVLNLSALYIPERFLRAAGHRVVGAHYGDLPRVRGLDTIRWSLLLDQPLVVSHMFLVSELDMGDVVARTPVAVRRGDDVGAARRRCQAANAAGHLRVVEQMLEGELHREPQRRKDGSTFFRMGAYLRERVDAILREERYSHYSDGTGME